MSLFKRLTAGKQDSPSPFRQVLGVKANSTNSVSSNSTHSSASSLQTEPRLVTPSPSLTDPDTCLEVFQFHWKQALSVIQNSKGSSQRRSNDDVETVMRYVNQMALLLVEEAEGPDGSQGPTLDYLLTENILEVLLSWALQHSSNSNGTTSNSSALHSSDVISKLRLQQLKLYELLISQCKQPLLLHKPIIRPLLKLLSACDDDANSDIEKLLILILHQLCVSVTQNKHILELLFNATADHGSASFLVFSLLIPYVHREGSVGQQARDALLLIMSLSYSHEDIARYVAHNSHFCPVLATGLSGLYSLLPQKIKYPRDDWCQITPEDVTTMPDLVMFLNSLEFCNAVVQVAHPLVRDQLLHFIYNGFLVPVLGPALHQNDVECGDDSDVDSLMDSDHEDNNNVSSVEEVIAATAYTDLFLRTITEPTLICTFLRFILSEKFDETFVLESLIQRVHSNSRLCMVTLVLFHTLVGLNCEDVMFQLIFKYIIPCTHVMVSQRRAVRDVDIYNKTAEKLLSLVPVCCQKDLTSEETLRDVTDSSGNSHSLLDSDANHTSPPETPSKPAPKKRFNFGFRRKPTLSSSDLATSKSIETSSIKSEAASSNSDLSEVSGSTVTNAPVMSLKDMETWTLGSSTASPTSVRSLRVEGASTAQPPQSFKSGYREYLTAARHQIELCAHACSTWTAVYDGHNPSASFINTTPTLLTTNPSSRKDPVTDDHKLSCQSNTPSADKAASTSDTIHSTESVLTFSVKGTSVTGSSSETSSTGVTKSADIEECSLDKSTSDSECDSALSSVSNGDPVTLDTNEQVPRDDSPLADNFNTDDFNSFLLQLKRVKTPVEYCDSLEDTVKEIESLCVELRSQESAPVTVPIDSPKRSRSMLASSPLECLPCFTDKAPSLTRPTSLSPLSTNPLYMRNPSAHSLPANLLSPGSTPLQDTPTRSSYQDVDTPTALSATGKYVTAAAPDIGPFLTTLLSKLDCMMQNSLYVNLHLTGLITRLACYPHPLLRSFLLNNSLVFQPSVKSLIQVLSSVKHKLDSYSTSVKEFDVMLMKARKYLLWREEAYLRQGESRLRSDSTFSILNVFPKSSVKQDVKRKGSAIGDFFFGRNKAKSESGKPANRLQMLADGKGFHFLNHPNPLVGESTTNHMEALRMKNAVYCALVLEEFVKELSALAQVHAVLAYDL